MNILNLLGINDVLAAAATPGAPTAESGLMSMLPMLVAFGLIFYFLLIRPQNKRAKEQRKMISQLAKGDEVLTNGGLLGKINKLNDEFIGLEIAQGVEITMQKAAIIAALPKGTIKFKENSK